MKSLKDTTQFILISDSHGAVDRVESVLKLMDKAGLKVLLHAGDFVVEGVAEVLAAYPDIQIFIARGNADVNETWVKQISDLDHVTLEPVIRLVIAGKKVVMVHNDREAIGLVGREGDIDIMCHGHTHVARGERMGKTFILNPGALVEDGRYMLVDLEQGKVEHLALGR